MSANVFRQTIVVSGCRWKTFRPIRLILDIGFRRFVIPFAVKQILQRTKNRWRNRCARNN
jgi:hypothetical protein